MEFMNDSYLLSQGFFADKVVGILRKTGPIDTNDETVLKRVKDFLNKILDGQKEGKTEKLSCTALETMDAYQKALNILSNALLHNSENLTSSKFKELMDQMSNEIEDVLQKKEVTTETTALDFFEYLQKQTADEASEYMSERAAQRWPFPATSFRMY